MMFDLVNRAMGVEDPEYQMEARASRICPKQAIKLVD
jgi:hypothetical protein